MRGREARDFFKRRTKRKRMKGLNKFGNDDKANASTFVLIIVIALNLIGGVEGMLQPLKYAEPETLFPVLFESNRVLVVRKPHGIGHHDESSSFAALDNKDQRHEALSTPGVLRLLRSERQRQRDEEGERLYGVHRLDKVTSGILVFAKDTLTASTLSEYFTTGKIQKVYFGMSAKKPQKKKQGLVQGGMTRSRNKSWKLLRKPKHGEKPQRNFAKTRFFTTGIQANQIIDQGGDVINAMSKVKTVAMFRPYTGRTHQLRVAAKAMGIPLLGDPIYKDGGVDKNNTGLAASSSSPAAGPHTYRAFT